LNNLNKTVLNIYKDYYNDDPTFEIRLQNMNNDFLTNKKNENENENSVGENKKIDDKSGIDVYIKIMTECHEETAKYYPKYEKSSY